MTVSQDDYFVCPHCGAEVKVGAVFCRACGASNDSGWGDRESGDAADTWDEDTWDDDDDDFDYGEYVAREFPEHVELLDEQGTPYDWKQTVFALIVLALIVSLLAMFFPV